MLRPRVRAWRWSYGAVKRIRTLDPLLTKQPLYQLSYNGKLAGYLGFEPSAS